MGVKSKEGRIGSGPNCSHWFWASLSVALGSLSVSVSVCLCVCLSLSAGVLGVWVWVSIHSSPSSPSPSPLPFIISSFVSHVSTTTLIPISLFVFLPSLSLSQRRLLGLTGSITSPSNLLLTPEMEGLYYSRMCASSFHFSWPVDSGSSLISIFPPPSLNRLGVFSFESLPVLYFPHRHSSLWGHV